MPRRLNDDVTKSTDIPYLPSSSGRVVTSKPPACLIDVPHHVAIRMTTEIKSGLTVQFLQADLVETKGLECQRRLQIA